MKTLILGLGNPLLSDDSVGLHIINRLKELISSLDITISEASVGGLDFLELLTGFDKAIVIDAIQTEGGHPGQVYRLGPGAFKATQHASSPHDVDFATALELGKRLGIALPCDVVIFAVEAGDVTTFSEQCTPGVERAIDVVTEMVLNELHADARCEV